MKKRSVIAFVLSLVTLLSLFGACASGDDKKKDDDGKEKVDLTGYVDISEYKIVRSYSASVEMMKKAGYLKSYIKNAMGVEIPVCDDQEKETEHEILFGNTNRKESAAALEKLSQKTSKEAFVIDVVGSKIVINGFSEDDIVLGAKIFVNTYTKDRPSDKHLSIKKGDFTVMKKTEEVLYSDANAVITLERLTDVFVPDISSIDDPKYGKVIKLEHQADEKNNGILLASREPERGLGPWPIYRSRDDGKTWEQLPTLRDKINGGTPGYQPFLYELPEDVGEYKKGTVLFAGCTRIELSSIMLFVQASTDLGESWEGISNITVGGSHAKAGTWDCDGVWEPFLVMENGKLYCFYSDELQNGEGPDHIGGHNQTISYKSTTDLVNWSERKNAVALGKLRPGMAALAKMGNGKWALAYEMAGESGPPVYIKFSDSLEGFDPSEKGVKLQAAGGQGFVSSPALAWTPNGGPCGVLFAAGHANYGGSKGDKCDLFMSFDYGKTFVTIKNPIPMPVNPKLWSGYSPGMYVDKNGDLYYVNNPECMKGLACGKLSFAKIKIY